VKKKLPPPKPTAIPKSDKQVLTCTVGETYDEDANMISLANYVQDGNAVAVKEQKDDPFTLVAGEAMDVQVDGEKVTGWNFVDKWKPPSYANKAKRKLKMAQDQIANALKPKLSQTLVKQEEGQVDYLAEMAVNDTKEETADQKKKDEPVSGKGSKNSDQDSLAWYKPAFAMPPKEKKKVEKVEKRPVSRAGSNKTYLGVATPQAEPKRVSSAQRQAYIEKFNKKALTKKVRRTGGFDSSTRVSTPRSIEEAGYIIKRNQTLSRPSSAPAHGREPPLSHRGSVVEHRLELPMMAITHTSEVSAAEETQNTTDVYDTLASISAAVYAGGHNDSSIVERRPQSAGMARVVHSAPDRGELASMTIPSGSRRQQGEDVSTIMDPISLALGTNLPRDEFGSIIIQTISGPHNDRNCWGNLLTPRNKPDDSKLVPHAPTAPQAPRTQGPTSHRETYQRPGTSLSQTHGGVGQRQRPSTARAAREMGEDGGATMTARSTRPMSARPATSYGRPTTARVRTGSYRQNSREARLFPYGNT